MTPELRARLAKAAVDAARAVGYVNAGTVEFLLAPSGDFYFLEMNTRLQVEHPVTEEAFGVDLVLLQLAVAAGEKLPPLPSAPTRHAIEARVYAEDPDGGVPAAGRARVLLYREPAGPGMRVDSGLAEGQDVGVHYDPLLAKVVASRRDARGGSAAPRRRARGDGDPRGLDERVVAAPAARDARGRSRGRSTRASSRLSRCPCRRPRPTRPSRRPRRRSPARPRRRPVPAVPPSATPSTAASGREAAREAPRRGDGRDARGPSRRHAARRLRRRATAKSRGSSSAGRRGASRRLRPAPPDRRRRSTP